MAGITEAGEGKAWKIISSRKPDEISRAASVSYDPEHELYRVWSFGMEFIVSMKDRLFFSDMPGSEILLTRLGEFFRLSLLWYLASAKDVPCTERLVKLEGISGGDIFTTRRCSLLRSIRCSNFCTGAA